MQGMVSDLNMLRRLEDIRLEQTGTKDDSFNISAADPLYAEAFRQYGVDVENLEAGEAGERIRARPIYLELAAALDDWAHVRHTSPRGGGKASWKDLLAAARVADPDRSAQTGFGMPWNARRGTERFLEDLAASADIALLPAPTLVLLGNSLWLAGDSIRRPPCCAGPAAPSRRLLG